MKIAFIITNADLAGAPIHLECLINCFGERASIDAIFGEEGPIIDRLRSSNTRISILPRLRSAVSPKNDLIVLFQLVKLLRKISPDIVHLHSSKAAMIGRMACIILGIPWIYTVHGWGWRGFGNAKSKIILGIEKILSLSLKGFYIYVSKSVESEALSIIRIQHDRGRVIYNGVTDCGHFPEPIGPLRIFMAARVCAAKDHETLVRAFERVCVPSRLILCGEGTDSNDFRRQVESWAPMRHLDIELLGVRNDVRLFLHSINLVALISNFEALPLAIIEAMASGRAVIATNVGGVSELIEPGVSGALVPKGGADELVKAIERLSHQALRNNIGMAARKRYEEVFNELGMTTAVWNVYQEMIKSGSDK